LIKFLGSEQSGLLHSFPAAQLGHSPLACLVKEFVGSEQSGLLEQIAELLKQLVDPGALAAGCSWAELSNCVMREQSVSSTCQLCYTHQL
jgi:hypothetical protein